ncbi:MAG: class I SAM-dependent methyltransferase [Mangrovibacterium sp.]
MKHSICPCCQSKNLKDFFVLKNAPIHSLVTIKTYEEAIAIPRKDITLTICTDCSFVFNSSFDTSIDFFTNGYEDQQGFSSTFRMFLTKVTNRFIDKYNIREKDVVEIGCGKGDFINLFCELGNNRGIGIDPAYVPGRNEPHPNVSFIREFYSEKHGELPMDAITCRHTMEHIHDTNTFVKTIRKSLKEGHDVKLLIEVPCIVRILNIQAFWDIFYEHCSYFSPGSLARLFRKNKFEVLDTYLEYDNQYLFLEAQPSQSIQSAVHPLEESVTELQEAVDDFVVKINDQLGSWRKNLQEMKDKGQKVVVWGGGSKSVGFLTQFDDLQVIEHVVDINPHMQGNFIPGIGIQYITPDQLKEVMPDVVIIMNGVYKNEINSMLAERGMHPELICL